MEKGGQLPQVPQQAFRSTDEAPNEEFYRTPRLATQLYREFFPQGGEILDLMSSWVSHLPPEVEYRRVIGLDMNEVDLRRNGRLDSYLIQKLNTDPHLSFGNADPDVVELCVSIDYLTRPVEALHEVGGVLKVGTPLLITFSDRCPQPE